MLVFGGHGPDFEKDITGFRTYDSGTGKITSTQMQSGRWYPTPVTLPDGRVRAGGLAWGGEQADWASASPAPRCSGAAGVHVTPALSQL